MGSARHQTSSPSEYFVLGFKDRNLEAEYWNDVALTSKPRIILGYFVSILILLAGPIMSEIAYARSSESLRKVCEESGTEDCDVQLLATYGLSQVGTALNCITFIVMAASLVACFFIYRSRRFKSMTR